MLSIKRAFLFNGNLHVLEIHNKWQENLGYFCNNSIKY